MPARLPLIPAQAGNQAEPVALSPKLSMGSRLRGNERRL